MANTVPTSHPPERGQASLREAKGLVHDTARQKGGHTCVCVCGGSAATRVSTHLPSHALARPGRGSVTSGKACLEGNRVRWA